MNDFEGFVAARAGALHRLAVLLSGSQQDAQDLVQVALVKAWTRFDRLSREGNFEAYVRRIVLNEYLSGARREARRRALREAWPFGSESHQPQADLEETLLIFDALRLLSSRQRAVVVLRFYEDRSESDVATLLGCSVGTVKTHQHRALAALRANPALRELVCEGEHP
jgi:RNA polymerase sigma-70 factor (sigma-E family)